MGKRSRFELARFGNARLNWVKPIDGEPQDRMLCLVVVNDAIVPDIFVYFAEEKKFVAGTEKSFGYCDFINVQAWCAKKDIPPPHWLEVEIRKREQEGEKTIELAGKYQKQKGDLFGKVIDPDDVAEDRIE